MPGPSSVRFLHRATICLLLLHASRYSTVAEDTTTAAADKTTGTGTVPAGNTGTGSTPVAGTGSPPTGGTGGTKKPGTGTGKTGAPGVTLPGGRPLPGGGGPGGGSPFGGFGGTRSPAAAAQIAAAQELFTCRLGVDCRDRDPWRCQVYFRNNGCNRNPIIRQSLCRRTCKNCQCQGCADTVIAGSCAARKKYCNGYLEVRKACPKTCNACIIVTAAPRGTGATAPGGTGTGPTVAPGGTAGTGGTADTGTADTVAGGGSPGTGTTPTAGGGADATSTTVGPGKKRMLLNDFNANGVALKPARHRSMSGIGGMVGEPPAFMNNMKRSGQRFANPVQNRQQQVPQKRRSLYPVPAQLGASRNQFQPPRPQRQFRRL